MNDRKTHRDQLLAALLNGERVTAMDGLRRWKCFRTGARAFDLKTQGYDVRSERIKLPSGKWVARYYMKS
jgi:hypothetical protein